MYRNANDLIGYTVSASDGDAGTLLQFLFDEDTWTVRYLAVRTGNWFLRQMVLVSPIALRAILDDKKSICVRHKKSMIGNGPLVNMTRPIPHHYEEKYYSYYGWPVYWGQNGRWGSDLLPSALFTASPLNEVPRSEPARATYLLSSAELGGFAVFGSDDKIGQVKDLIIDDETWEVRYLLVDASAIGQKQAVISPHWLANSSLSDKVITADIPVQSVKNAPAFPGTKALTRDYDEQLFEHYGFRDAIDAIGVRQRVLV